MNDFIQFYFAVRLIATTRFKTILTNVSNTGIKLRSTANTIFIVLYAANKVNLFHFYKIVCFFLIFNFSA